MGSFTASKQLSALKFDFEEFSPDPSNPLRGQVPEPSPAAVHQFNRDCDDVLQDIGIKITDRNDRVEMAKHYNSLTVEQENKIADLVGDAVAKVTQNNPPRDQWELLGNRARLAFREWLQRELNNPEAPGAGSRS